MLLAEHNQGQGMLAIRKVDPSATHTLMMSFSPVTTA
jgi:hypothetical protein